MAQADLITKQEIRGLVDRCFAYLTAETEAHAPLFSDPAREINEQRRMVDEHLQELRAQISSGEFEGEVERRTSDLLLKHGYHADAPKAREFAEMMLKTAGLSEPDPANYKADKERPFLDPVCWALFSAYRQCSTYPAMLFQLAKAGVGPDVLESSPPMLQALKTALPEHAEYIDQNGLGSLYHLLQPLEERLLAALVASLNGRESSEAAVRHAAEIIEKVQEADTAMKARPTVPASP